MLSLIMCSEPEDLRQRSGWDGASGISRQRLLTNLQRKSLLFTASGYSFISCPLKTTRLHSVIYHDTTTAIFRPSSTSSNASTTTMCLPQFTDKFIGIFIIHGPSMRQRGVSKSHDNNFGSTYRRSLEYGMES